MTDYHKAYTGGKETPQTRFNDTLKNALGSEFWYTGEVAYSIFGEHDPESYGPVSRNLERLHLEDNRRASLSIYRGTSAVTGEDAFLVITGNQNTLYADKETVFENHSRLRAPGEVTKLNHIGYSGQWAAWALEQEGLTKDDLDPDIGGTESVGHSPPTENGPSVEEVLCQRDNVPEPKQEDDAKPFTPPVEKLCEECGQHHTREYIKNTPHGEWRPNDPVFCICC